MKRLGLIFLLSLSAAAPAGAAAPHQRIIGGSQTPIEAYPYVVSLGYTGAPTREAHFCGGAVIAPDVVLTAAHCVTGERARRIVVTAGRARLSDEASGQRVRVRRIFVHPRYGGAGHDVALLRLATPVAAPPVALSPGGDWASAFTVGWGLTDADGRGGIPNDLRAVEIPVQPGRACRRFFGPGFDAGQMVCAGGDGRDSCNGDSGGPLVAANTAGIIEVIGIVSFGGPRCAVVGEPGAYTRVSAERGWIARTLAPAPAPEPEPEPEPVEARVHFGHIDCNGIRCRVELNVRHDKDVEAIEVRGPRGSARARRVAPGRWLARLALPRGAYALTAQPLAAGGTVAGPTARVRLRVS